MRRGLSILYLRFLGILLAAQSSCTAIANTSLGAGIGGSCQSDNDCHHARCIFNESFAEGVGGICATGCATQADCPPKALCANSFCQPEIAVGALFVGNADDLDGWTFSHDAGLRTAAAELGYVDLNIKYAVLPGTATPILNSLLPISNVVIANGIDYENELIASSKKNQNIKYLMVDNNAYNQGFSNITPYGVYFEEGYYVAGRIAAQMGSKRLGFIAGFIYPETSRVINAFILGARSVKPNIVVEVRYLGFFNDINTAPTQIYTDSSNMQISYFREQLLARLLLDSGCDVIAHYTNTQRSVRLVHELDLANKLPTVKPYTIAFGTKDACKDGAGQLIPTCLGSVFTDWTRLYRNVLDEIGRHIFAPLVPIRADIDDTMETATGFAPNPVGRNVDVSAIQFENQTFARATNPGPRQRVFTGPFQLNGQRDSDFDGIPDAPALQVIAAGETISDAENARGCFFVKGVVEKIDPDDPNSQDRDALVPGGLRPQATMPDSSEPLLVTPANKYNVLVVPSGVATECRKNAPPAPPIQ